MINLTIRKILEFYDVPQLFVATDTIGTNYLCVLFSHDNGYEYLGVQVSELRLSAFLNGDMDLVKLYSMPEQDNSLYHVVVKDRVAIADKLLQPTDITVDMLPEPGFYYNSDDAIEDSNADAVQIVIPAKDRSFFADMVARMGWATKTIDHAVRRIAVL